MRFSSFLQNAKLGENSFLKLGNLNSLHGEEGDQLPKNTDAKDGTSDDEEEWDA